MVPTPFVWAKGGAVRRPLGLLLNRQDASEVRLLRTRDPGTRARGRSSAQVSERGIG